MLKEKGIVFQVDNELKHEFLDKQKKTTKGFYTYILKRADEYEAEIGKKIYDFNIEERDDFLIVKFKNGSKNVFQSTLSPLKKYLNFCIAKNIVKHNENRFTTILVKDYDNYINIQARGNIYISKSEVRELQKQLINPQDRLILELLTWGIRGRTEIGNTHEELINLKVNDIDYQNKAITLTNNDGEIRLVYIDDYTLDLIKQVIAQQDYVCSNGKISAKSKSRSSRILPVNKTQYVFRTPGKNRFGRVDHQLFDRKVQLMRKWLEKPYLSIGNLYDSAMIDEAKRIKEEKGELTRDDYIRINEKFQYGDTKERQTLYWVKTSELVNPYI